MWLSNKIEFLHWPICSLIQQWLLKQDSCQIQQLCRNRDNHSKPRIIVLLPERQVPPQVTHCLKGSFDSSSVWASGKCEPQQQHSELWECSVPDGAWPESSCLSGPFSLAPVERHLLTNSREDHKCTLSQDYLSVHHFFLEQSCFCDHINY